MHIWPVKMSTKLPPFKPDEHYIMVTFASVIMIIMNNTYYERGNDDRRTS